MPSRLAALVKGNLIARDTTQEWLAAQVGIAPTSLSRVLRGGRPPSKRLALAISAALGLTSAEESQLLEAAGYVPADTGQLNAGAPLAAGAGAKHPTDVDLASTRRTSILAGGGFDFSKSLSDADIEALLNGFRQLLTDRTLDDIDRGEIFEYLQFSLSLLLNRYEVSQ